MTARIAGPKTTTNHQLHGMVKSSLLSSPAYVKGEEEKTREGVAAVVAAPTSFLLRC